MRSRKRARDVQVEDGRALVALCNRMVRIVCELCTANYMAPLDTDLVSGLDVDDFSGDLCSEPAVAGHVVVVYILDGVVGVGHADANELAIICAVDTDALGDGVCGSECGQARDDGGEEPHVGTRDVNERLNGVP